MSINVEQFERLLVSEQAVEFVERKGIGHPDSLIDGIVENVSLALVKRYLDDVGSILHHNVDKGLIVGGSSDVSFGKGTITKPIEIIVAGRATEESNGKSLDIDGIAVEATRDYLKKHTRFLDLENEVRIVSKIRRGSADLSAIFKRTSGAPLANDTSFGIGFAPFTETERLALETEHMLNSPQYKKAFPMVGEDVKVMSVREDDSITLTVAIAFVSKFINNMDEYMKIKEKISADILKNARSITKKKVDVSINHGDSHERGEVYLTKSGLSCEAGDDGAVGRGNRVNGLITPFRFMSLEAAAGKNPVNHVGKIYNIVSKKIAEDIVANYPSIKECNVALVSQIGRPIDDPRSASINVVMEKGAKIGPIESKVRDIASESLRNISSISRDIAIGKYEMF
jgi:S-adenosylmethionine synthetase